MSTTLETQEAIRRGLETIVQPGDVFEVRIPNRPLKYGAPCTAAGWFDNVDDAAKWIAQLDRSDPAPKAVYVTLNPCNPDLLARAANKVNDRQDQATADKDITRRRWLLIDLDPHRLAGVSSTDEEKTQSRALAVRLIAFLRAEYGWPDPVEADSSNGWHLLYRIDLPNDAAATALVQAILKRLGEIVDAWQTPDDDDDPPPRVSVDQTVFNAARITKAYGCVSRKGDDIPARPHRRSRIVNAPDDPQPVTIGQLESLLAEDDEDGEPFDPVAARHEINGTFPPRRLLAEKYLTHHGIAFRKKDRPDGKGRDVYLLDVCPFDAAHDDGSAVMTQEAEGKLGFRCHHNGCSGRGWQALKSMFPPEDDHYDPPRAKKNGRPSGPKPKEHPQPAGDRRSKIEVTHDEDCVTAESLAVLSRDPSIFQRAGTLARIIEDDTPGHPDPLPKIAELPEAFIRERLAARCWFFVTMTSDKGEYEKRTAPPAYTIKALHRRGEYKGIRPLRGVVTVPFLRPDGSIATATGYDPKTHIVLHPVGPQPTMPDEPTRDDAIAAARDLIDLIDDFPVATDAHRAGWLACILSMLARQAYAGPTPMFLIDGNVRGAGKGLLASLATLIGTGCIPNVSPMPKTDDEMRKRITSIAITGKPVVLLDNIAGALGCPSLDAALTATVWEDRILGASTMVELPLTSIWLATGNNVQLGADTSRRVCPIRLESPDERPEERDGFRYPNILGHVRDNRARYLGDALTILRAWYVAGKPTAAMPSWGSYEDWSGIVRQCLAWIGQPDPWETREVMLEQSDTEAGALSGFIAAWREQADPDTWLTAAEILKQCDGEWPVCPALRDAVEEMAGGKGGLPSARSLGRYLRKYRGRVVGGMAITSRTDRTNSFRWSVKPIKPGNAGFARFDGFATASSTSRETIFSGVVTDIDRAETYPSNPVNPASEDRWWET